MTAIVRTPGERSFVRGSLRGHEQSALGDRYREPKRTSPYLSVIVPVHKGGTTLTRSLQALCESTLPREQWELIVVDDASHDDTDLMAAEYADVVIRLPGKPHGPAYARNRGSESARGEVIVFVDADVMVHADALMQFAAIFADGADVGAVFGSYDVNPPAPGFISQYRNLLHHYHHQINSGDAQTFWAGCGAVRAEVFRDAGMYDEWRLPRPQIEDIELGNRIHALGHRILLRPEIQCAHLKRWTLRGMIRTDLKDRGVPWARLLVAQGTSLQSNALNLKMREKVCTALVWLMLAAIGAALVLRRAEPAWAGAGALGIVLLLNRELYAFFERTRNLWFALRVIPVHVLYYCLNGVAAALGWLLHELLGGPAPDPSVEALAEVGVETWPPVPVKRTSGWW
jgi:glycosyltransferase involved in cell wall biosynthesis